MHGKPAASSARHLSGGGKGREYQGKISINVTNNINNQNTNNSN